MTSNIWKATKKFNKAFGHPVNKVPSFPEAKLPDGLAAELAELLSLMEKIDKLDTGKSVRALRIRLLMEEFSEYIHAELTNDMAECADALTDMSYINGGTCCVYGLPGEELFSTVHENNMSKLGPNDKPIRREDGKIMKPDTWSPPDLVSILRAHGL